MQLVIRIYNHQHLESV